MFDQIEKLKADLTDKYVMVAADLPELRRFAGYTGQVKTVNMSGQALVEFNAFNNIGWYDINPAYLRVVDKPAEGAPAKQVEAKASPAAKPAAAPAPGKPAAATPGAGKASTADILAAARANKAAGGAAPAAKAPAAAKPAPAKPAAGGKMSTADILAAARAKKAGGAEAVPTEAVPAEESPVEAAPVAKTKAKPAAGGALPTTTAEKIAWMRAHDSK